jgi:hypothetical protein
MNGSEYYSRNKRKYNEVLFGYQPGHPLGPADSLRELHYTQSPGK